MEGWGEGRKENSLKVTNEGIAEGERGRRDRGRGEFAMCVYVNSNWTRFPKKKGHGIGGGRGIFFL